MFQPVLSQVDFVALEKELLEYWYAKGIVEKYLHKNDSSDQRFSFLDGPITANNPMGVHHAWGRTYKDLWQRFYNMHEFKQRFQNGFDEQGLWVEVEVEKELGLKSKKDIENLVPGDRFASLEKFINLCKERVKKYSGVQTDQSKRLGYFMDWENSYHTSSDINNYSIWNYLKVVHEKGWLYKGRDSVPWCPRCGTAISQHEILTEEYKEITHTSVYFRLPVKGKDNTYLLVWTTTPWTIPANVAVAVDPSLQYVEVKMDDRVYIVAKETAGRLARDIGKVRVIREYKGVDLVGWKYQGSFDELPAVKEALAGYNHRVVASDPVILPIFADEGTGLVHIAPGAGGEDHALGKKEDLPIIGPIDESAVFIEGFGALEGLGIGDATAKIIDHLYKGDFLFKAEDYNHRYPTCWRCKTELVWRVVDEWYISMDQKDETAKTYREQMIEVIKNINWIPKWGYDRELDWLKNMHDWLISKKRYWGLSLPIWECQKCGNFEVIGSKEELKEKAVAGWREFNGHSPHKPWIDCIKIMCSDCSEVISRIPDVGNPWLDAGIVPFSTLPEDWFPADFITESFPGQFKNWFYSLIAMSTALKRINPFKNLLGFATMVDENGEPFHKSKGNAIEFVEAADRAGADIIRWMCVSQNHEQDLLFGYNNASVCNRRFYLILWNSYKFLVDYANLNSWDCSKTPKDIVKKLTILDRWILARLTEVTLLVNEKMEKYDATVASKTLEDFIVNDLSTWYIRRSRDRVGQIADEEDKNIFLSTIYGVLVTVSKLLAPFVPFISELIFRNLTNEESVHLQVYPLGDKKLLDERLIREMQIVREIGEKARAKRKDAGIKLRQPLALLSYQLPDKLDEKLEQILVEELNVVRIEHRKSSNQNLVVELDTKITPALKEEGEARDLIRQVQQIRKEQGLTLLDKIKIISPKLPKSKKLLILLLKKTNASEAAVGGSLKITVCE